MESLNNNLVDVISKKFYIILSLIVFVVFANTLSNNYNLDDNLVTQNHYLTSKTSDSTLLDIFTQPYYKDQMGYSYGYRPIVTLSFAIEHQLFDESAKVSHFFNLLLYCGIVLLVFRFLINYFGTDRIHLFFFTAVLFAIHPIHTEVVASIKNRDELLALFFSLLGAISALKYITRKSMLHLSIAVLYFSLAILSKKSIFPLIFIIPFILSILQQQKILLIILFQLLVALPVTAVAADFQLIGFVKLYSLVLVFAGMLVGVRYFQKYRLLNQEVLVRILILLTSVFFFCLFLYYHQLIFLFVSIIISLFNTKNKLVWVISQNVLQLFIASQFFDIPELFEINAFVTIGYFVYLINNKNWKSFWWFIPIFGCSMTPLLLNFNWIGVSVAVTAFFFFILIYKKWIIGMLYSIFSFCIAIVVFKLGMIHLLMLVFTIIYILISFDKIARYKFLIITFSSVFVLSFLQVNKSYFYNFENNIESSQITLSKRRSDISQIEDHQKSTIKEGRQLGYIENTLVAPHNQSQTIATGFYTLGKYGQLLIFPLKQSSYYGFSSVQTMGFNSVWVWLSFLFYLFLIAAAIYFFRKDKVITIGICWFLVSILLFSNWTELVAGMVAERLAFTASIGFMILVSASIYYFYPTLDLFKPKKKDFLVYLVLIALSVITIKRNSNWKDAVTLFSHDLKNEPNSAQLNNMYALAMMKEVTENQLLSFDEKKEYNWRAIYHLERACKIYPYSFNYYFDLGRSYILAQNFKKAYVSFEKAHQIVPKNSLALEELVKTAFDLKMKNETVYYGRKYLSIAPNNVQIHELVAYICLLNKDMELTRYFASRANKLFPENKNFTQMLIDCADKK